MYNCAKLRCKVWWYELDQFHENGRTLAMEGHTTGRGGPPPAYRRPPLTHPPWRVCLHARCAETNFATVSNLPTLLSQYSNWNTSPRSWRGWKEIQICKYRRKFGEISVKKWPSRLGEIGGAGGETGGWESEGRSDLVKFFKLFQNGRIWNSYMTESNSVELFNVEFVLAENQTSKVKIPLF